MKNKMFYLVLVVLFVLAQVFVFHPVKAAAGPVTTLSYQGQIGGASMAVAVVGNTAYLGVGPRLFVLDITNPSGPVVLAESPVLKDIVTNIVVKGSYAYLILGAGGFQIIQVKDGLGNAIAVEKGSSNDQFGPLGALALSQDGNYAYVADDAEMWVISLIDKNVIPPSLSLPLPPGGVGNGLVVIGNELFGAFGPAGVVTYDLTVVNSPVIKNAAIKKFDLAGMDASGIATDGTYLYLTSTDSGLAGAKPGFFVFTPTDLSVPVFEPTFLPLDSFAVSLNEVSVSGTTAYLVRSDGTAAALDVTTKNAPIYVFDALKTFGTANAVVGFGANFLVADEGANLSVYSFGPIPSPVGSYRTPGNVLDAAVYSGGVLGASELMGVSLTGVADPTTPVFSQMVALPTTGNSVAAIAVSGNYAYVAETDRLSVLDLTTNPPSVLANVDTPASDIVIQGNYAYVVANGGLQIVDITNPLTPVKKGAIAGASASGITIYGNTVFLAAGASGVRFINVADVNNPSLVTFDPGYASPGLDSQDVDAAYNPLKDKVFLYIADGTFGFRVIDVSDPAMPMQSGVYTSGFGFPQDAFTGLEVSGNMAFVVSNSGLRMLNLLNPAVPTLSYFNQSLPGGARRVTLENNSHHVYVSANQGGLYILDYPKADLSVIKTDGVDTLHQTAPNTYIITVINHGPDNASAYLKDLMPEKFTGSFTCVSTTPGLSSCQDASGKGDINELVTLAVNGAVQIELVGSAAVDAINLVYNRADIEPSTGITDPDLTNNWSFDNDILTPDADLELVVSGSPYPEVIPPGQTNTYFAKVTNIGRNTAFQSTLVVDAYSTFASDVLLSISSSYGCSPSSSSQIICPLGDLAKDESVILPISVARNTANFLAIRFHVSEANTLMVSHDINPLNNTVWFYGYIYLPLVGR